MYNAFDALVTNSEAIQAFLRDIGVTTRIEYIPNGVNLQRFHPARSESDHQARATLRERFGIPVQHKVIMAVGAIMPRKGPDKVLQAWRRILPDFPDTHVMFVGPRADTHDPKLQAFGAEVAELVASSGAPEQVHFTGIVDDVENYLRAADIFILASSREGTPNSVLEGMATVCGRLSDELAYQVETSSIATKEYPQGQVAYSVEFYRKGQRLFF